MIDRIVDFSVRNKLVVFTAVLLAAIAGWWSITRMPLDARFLKSRPPMNPVAPVTSTLPCPGSITLSRTRPFRRYHYIVHIFRQ